MMETRINIRSSSQNMPDFYYSWNLQSTPPDFPVERAEHDEFILRDGRRIYDFISTSFQANFGHSHSEIRSRITDQLNQMPIASPKSSFDLKEKVSKRLIGFVNLDGGKIFYTVSGAESVENALKISRQITGRKIVLARKKSYHGATLGALSVTGDWRNDPHLTFDEGTVRIPEHTEDPDLSQLASIIQKMGADKIAAIILETISGVNGMSVPPQEWFTGVQDLCRQNGILFILDEVLVGFGRCKTDFAFQHYGLTPDIVCMSKAISGGYIPFGAVWTSQAIASHYDQMVLSCGLTNYGHPLGLAALDAVLDTLENEEFRRQKSNLEDHFESAIEELEQHPNVTAIRCRGLMAAIELNRPAPDWQTGFDAGLHLYGKGNLNILAPPYVSSPERLDQALSTYVGLIEKPKP